MSMTRTEAAAEALRRHGAGNFELEGHEGEGVPCSFRIRVPDWPVMVRAGEGDTWEEAFREADTFTFELYREPGWCFPVIRGDRALAAEMKRAAIAGNRAELTGLDRIVGSHKGVPFEAVVGQLFEYRDDDTNEGIVLGILRLQENLLGIVTTQRGLLKLNPVLVGTHELRSELAYQLEAGLWEGRGRETRAPGTGDSLASGGVKATFVLRNSRGTGEAADELRWRCSACEKAQLWASDGRCGDCGAALSDRAVVVLYEGWEKYFGLIAIVEEGPVMGLDLACPKCNSPDRDFSLCGTPGQGFYDLHMRCVRCGFTAEAEPARWLRESE